MESLGTLFLTSKRSLTALNISRNPLGGKQPNPLLALAKNFEHLRLKVIDMSSCALLGPSNHRYRGLIVLGEAFTKRKHLTHLRLADNHLHSE
ncbi:unnamed protein product, partial [Choristocarpus tenellus]